MSNLQISTKTLTQYRAYLADMEKSLATIDKYLRDIRSFLTWMGEDTTLSKERVIAYKAWLQEHYKTSSANSMLTALNCFLTYLGEAKNRVRTIKVQKQLFRPADKELGRGEYERLLVTARKKGQEQTALIMETIGATGIRISELKYITVEAVETGRTEVTCKGKKEIFLKMQAKRQTFCLVQEKGIRKGPVFISCNGNPLDRSNIWSRMKAVAKAAGVDPGRYSPTICVTSSPECSGRNGRTSSAWRTSLDLQCQHHPDLYCHYRG